MPLLWPQPARKGVFPPCSSPQVGKQFSWKDSNPRANTVAAFLLIELVITTILAVLAAGVHVPIVGSSDSAAKKEDRKEDGAPPVAEEQA